MEKQILSFPVLLSFVLFILMILRIWKKSNPPPGPWKLPLLGNIHQLAGGALPHHRLRDLAKTYGPVMSIQLGQISAVVISSVQGAKEVLKTQGEVFAERPLIIAAKIVLYNRKDIVFGSYGDHWRQMRKICTLELLSAKRVQSFRSVREEEVSEFVRFLQSKAGTPVNLTKTLFALTNSIMARTSIGKKCEKQETFSSVIDGVTEVSGGFTVADVFPSLGFLHVITGMKSRLERLHRVADQIFEDIIAEHKATRALSKNDDPKEAANLLDVLLDLQEHGNLQVPLTNDSIKAAILEMFGAGSDTSSKTTEWAMSELMRNPTEMRKAQEEVRRVFGETGKVDETRLHELKFLKLVVKETLRLHPAIALIPRECRERTKVDGYDIKPTARVLVNVWAIGRDPNVWSEPERFHPERFVNSSVDFKGTDFELLPFGAGKRICPGILVGITNLELVLAHLLYHFDWKFVDGVTSDSFDMREGFGGALHRKSDLILIPIPFTP
ncbi:premnaspirodiene oxygenase isoform X1 [Ricinus communis]|uniref:CYP726A17 n=1 Tax=Ricinus communis TaxID=3988 RepID=B9RHX0_RICCO|nr:premnaspirodiene oxygenase [Ricinus communis]XP_048228438.1 premnaspirodiene oxygenase isoform X1 [Ricinus communis]AIM47548.1 CYP726A17 [Ricinus communis]EEF48742.1 cytochrome P450, putative [Ricinus communis]|eukprot:NP_001310626.1 premnaspirodiene oxygenase [Ricinus communis]